MAELLLAALLYTKTVTVKCDVFRRGVWTSVVEVGFYTPSESNLHVGLTWDADYVTASAEWQGLTRRHVTTSGSERYTWNVGQGHVWRSSRTYTVR